TCCGELAGIGERSDRVALQRFLRRGGRGGGRGSTCCLVRIARGLLSGRGRRGRGRRRRDGRLRSHVFGRCDFAQQLQPRDAGGRFGGRRGGRGLVARHPPGGDAKVQHHQQDDQGAG